MFIKCPECGEKAELFQEPNVLAGEWDCKQCSSWGECPHTHTEEEETYEDYHDPSEPDGHGQRIVKNDVCVLCRCVKEAGFSSGEREIVAFNN